MAKAAVQARGGRAATGGKAAGKAAAGAQPRKRGTNLWAKIVALVILFPFAAVLLPTTLVFSVMMADRNSTRLNSSHYCASRLPPSDCKQRNHIPHSTPGAPT